VKRSVTVLVGGSLVFWLVTSSCFSLIGKNPQWNDPVDIHLFSNSVVVLQRGVLFGTVALIVCLIPTIATLIWANQAAKQSAFKQLIIVFGSTGIRMGFVLLGAILLYVLVEEFQRTLFWIVILAFYLYTLALEIIIQNANLIGKGQKIFSTEKPRV